MKCSHGLPYEVKCSGCFKDAMERVSASQKKLQVMPTVSEAARERFWLSAFNQTVDKPRGLL